MTGPRIDRAERTIPADPARVFDAWRDDRKLAAWLPPEGATAEFAALDCRTGGDFRMVLHFWPGAQGKAGPARDEVAGRFTEVTPPESLTLAIRFPSEDPAFAGIMRMYWTFTPDPDGTLVRVACHDVPAGIPADAHEEALSQSLAKLSALFSGAPTSKETT